MTQDEEHQHIEALRTATRERDEDEGRLNAADPPGSGTSSDEAWFASDLHRPLDAEEKDRLFDRVDRSRAAQAPQPLPKAIKPWGGVAKLGVAKRGVAMATASLAMAAAALLALRTSPPSQMGEVAWSRPLGEQQAEPIQKLDAPDDRLAVTLDPLKPSTEPLQIRGALLVQDGRAIPWQPVLNPASDDGKLRITGARTDLFPCLGGMWTMIVAVGLPGAALPATTLQAEAGKGPKGDHQVLRMQLWLGAPVGRDGKPCGTGAR